jgi:nitrogen-specific signal transduction histidine kinase
MGLADSIKDLRKKAEDAAVEHKDQLQEGVQRAQAVADQRTAGKYHEQIHKVGGKASALIEALQGEDPEAPTGPGPADEPPEPRQPPSP